MWIGSEAGLQRFDGNNFVNYKYRDNELSHSTVRVLLVDKEDNLWIGTQYGVDFYDTKLERFTSIDINSQINKGDSSSEKFLYIRSLYLSPEEELWIGSYEGLTKYNTKTKKIKHFALPKIRAIKPIDDKKFLLGTLDQGLLIFDSKNGTFYNLFESKNTKYDLSSFSESNLSKLVHTLSTVSVTNITKDDNDLYYISTWGKGLLRLDLNSLSVDLVSSKEEHQYVQVLKKDRLNNYWLTGLNGIFYAENKLHNLRKISSNTGTALDETERFRDIFELKNGDILITSYDLGIFYHSLSTVQFEHFRVPNKGKKANNITEIQALSDSELVLGSSSSEIMIFNTNSENFRTIPTDSQLSSFDVMDIRVTQTNKELLLITDLDSNWYRLNIEDKEITYSHLDLEVSARYTFLPKSNENSKHIFAVDRTSKTLTILKLKPNHGFQIIATSEIVVDDARTTCNCRELEKNKFLVALKGHPLLILKLIEGSLVIDQASEQINYEDNIQVVEIPNQAIILFPKGEDVLSFQKYDLSNSSKIKFNHQLNSISRSSYDELSDTIWLSSSDGIMRINANDWSYHLFDEFDGLQGNDFNWASASDSNGFIYFGGTEGFTRFIPSKINLKDKALSVNLTDLSINNSRYVPTADSEIAKSIVLASALEINFDQNSFAIEFSSPTLPGEQSKLTYAYILEGFESKWHYVDYKKRIASYTNIPHGDYIFRVKVQNKNGIWSEQDRTLAISISPPWWLTTWAYLAYILTVILVFYAAIQYRTKALTRRSKFLEKEVTARTKEVEQLLEKQNQEFANISHEFRTPLTLILGPISNVLKKLNPKTQSSEIKQLETTQRNSYRLLRMVDQLLNIESFQVKSIVQKQPIAFGETTRLIADGFKELAKEKNCEFIVEDIAQINFEFTPDAYEKILLNLLSNAFKYTPTNGKISLKTSIEGSEFILTVSDTGIGIPVEEQANIFERFNRSTNVNQENAPGAGIGLSLVKNLVELHQGKIQLESQPQIGTTFTVTLPIVNRTNNAEFIYGIDESLIDVELMTLAAQSPATSQVVSAAGDENTNRETILIIEDNDDMRHYIQESVSATYKVSTASDGEQGVSIAVQEIPDLIISDIMMPKLDGYQVTSQLRQHTATSHIPIILLTAKDDKVSRMKGWHERADEYLTKPFDVNELNIRIKSLLEIRDLLKQRFADSIFKTDAPSNSTDELENQEQIFIKNLNKVMEEFYTDHQIKISEISSKVAMSDRQLSRKLKSTVDMTPTEYLRKYRLERAKDLLSNGETVTNTAFQVGFTSSSYFTSCFKAHVGVKPSEFTSLKKA